MRLMIIDCENTNCDIINETLQYLKLWQVVLVIGINQNNTYKKYDWVDELYVDGSGSNYADFVVVSELVEKINTNKYQSACVISDDLGFDTVIDYLKKQGHVVNKYSEYDFCKKFCKSDKLTITKTPEMKTKGDLLSKAKQPFKESSKVLDFYITNKRVVEIREKFKEYMKMPTLCEEDVIAKFCAERILALIKYPEEKHTHKSLKKFFIELYGTERGLKVYNILVTSNIIRNDSIDFSVRSVKTLEKLILKR